MTKNEVLNIMSLYREKIMGTLSAAPDKMILFGSYARGDNRADSDVDILLLFDVSQEDISKYADTIYDISYDMEEIYGIEINPCVQQSEIFNKWKEVSPFFINVQREGIAV